MKILIGHNRYQAAGGEDAVVATEAALLKSFGHAVRLYERNNTEFDSFSLGEKIRHLISLGWSDKTYRELNALIKEFQPDVVHFHNIFFMLTPSAYAACKAQGVPVVQSLHNFRPLCSNGLFYRDQQVCEKCSNKNFLHGIYHRCFKKSTFASAFVARMLAQQWKKSTWTNCVDFFITATEFTKKKYVQGGLPGEKIMIKPNFLYPYPAEIERRHSKEPGFALYVGRLSEEKGVDVLLAAWKSVNNLSLKIMGDGHLAEGLKKYVREQQMNNVEFLGFATPEQYDENMRQAKFLVVPSRCYENFPRVIAEAYAYGLPVIASRLGSLAEIVADGQTGYLFNPGEASDLAGKINQTIADGNKLRDMSLAARRIFKEKYEPQEIYQSLMTIYERAIAACRKSQDEHTAKN